MQEIEVHITLKGIDAATLVRLLTAAQGNGTIASAGVATRPVKTIEAEVTKDDTSGDTKEKKKGRGPGKKKKEPEPEEDESDEEDEDETEESADEDGSGDEGEDEDEDEEEGRAKKKPKKGKSGSDDEPSGKKITLDDVLAAFAAYTKAHDRDAASKVLKKFDIKMIRKAPEEIWPKLIKALKV